MRLAGSIGVGLKHGVPVSHAGMVVEANHGEAIGDIGHKLGHRLRRGCCGPSVGQSVPGHEGVLPVGLGRCGGALG